MNIKAIKFLASSRVLALSISAALIGFISGCASPAKSEAMVPKQLNVAHKHPHSLAAAVTGGQKTNPLWKSDVSDEAFLQAVVNSIKQTGVFSSVVNQGSSDYRLEITLVKLLQPIIGFNFTVTAVTEWRLTDVASGKIICEEFISTPFTATVGDEFAAVARLRAANEGAARENIKEGIRRLSELQLPAKATLK